MKSRKHWLYDPSSNSGSEHPIIPKKKPKLSQGSMWASLGLPLRPHFMRSLPLITVLYSHASLPTISGTCQASFHFWAFAQNVLPHISPKLIHMDYLHSGPCSSTTSSGRLILIMTAKVWHRPPLPLLLPHFIFLRRTHCYYTVYYTGLRCIYYATYLLVCLLSVFPTRM